MHLIVLDFLEVFEFIGAWEAVIGLKLSGREGCVGLRRESVGFPDLQNVETLILVILDLNWFILSSSLRNSSFIGSVGLIIDSTRSGSLFASCLTSSTYFFYN